MYVCMYVCMHACMHACMYVYTHNNNDNDNSYYHYKLFWRQAAGPERSESAERVRSPPRRAHYYIDM